jgi:hypothetical protein
VIIRDAFPKVSAVLFYFIWPGGMVVTILITVCLGGISLRSVAATENADSEPIQADHDMLSLLLCKQYAFTSLVTLVLAMQSYHAGLIAGATPLLVDSQVR